MTIIKGNLKRYIDPNLGYKTSQKKHPPVFIAEQVRSQRVTIGKQNKVTIGNPLVNNQATFTKPSNVNQETISKPYSTQSRATIDTPLVNNNPDVSVLTGLQRKILFHIVEDCIYRGELTSGYITNSRLREITNSTANVVKTTVQRLINKGFIERNPDKNGKPGKGGFSSFLITHHIRDSVLREARNPSISNPLVNQLVNNISNPLVNNQSTNKETITSSSSSLNNITTTTVDEWNFDISTYAKFAFTAFHIKQLSKLDHLSAAAVEQSLIEFNHDFENNSLPVIKTTMINFLMGLLRSGNIYVSESYRNEQEAIISEMSRRAENKRKKLLEDRFWAWEARLSQEERTKVEDTLPLHLMVIHRIHGLNNKEVQKWLFNYYLQTKSNP